MICTYVAPFVGKGLGREQALLTLFKKLRIPYHVHRYISEREEHRNYLFSLGKKEPCVLLTAHYDAFPDCPGANDDASGIAVLLALYQFLRKKKIKKNINFGIFDQEEKGCLGSYAFAEKNRKFSTVISLELVGYGEVMGLWPITEETRRQPMYKQILETLKEKKIPYQTAGELPIFYSDFTPFREKGIKDSFCITMIPKKEVQFIKKVIKKPSILQLQLQTGIALPSFFEHYHSEKDTMNIIQESALRRVSDVLKETIISTIH